MSYERFIKKDGKIYGPYTYQSKRVDGKIVSSYVKPKKNSRKIILSAIIFISIFALLIVAMYFISNPTGRVTLQLSQDSSGAISGNLNLLLKNGELIPANSIVRVSLNGETKEVLLSDLINESISNGSFYAENSELSGFGEGFGFAGEKVSYPDVYFSMFLDEKLVDNQTFENSTNISVVNQTYEAEVVANESQVVLGGGSGSLEGGESSGEIASPINSAPVVETIENSSSDSESGSESSVSNSETLSNAESNLAETSVVGASSVETPTSSGNVGSSEGSVASSDSSSSSSSDSSSSSSDSSSPSSSDSSSSSSDSSSSSEGSSSSGDGGGSGITGNVIGDFSFEEEISGKVNKNSPFVYSLNGRHVSLRNIYSDFENLSSSDLNIKEENDEVIITTDYSKNEIGFGKDFLSDNLNELSVPLAGFGLAGNGTFSIDIIYGDSIIASASKELGSNVSLENQTNVSLEILANIGEVEVAKNSSLVLDLSDYFSAESYSINNVKNISFAVDGTRLSIIPDENFVGARSAVVFAYAGNESISQKFIIKVLNSSNIVTKQFRAVINKPVKWVKSIDVGNDTSVSLEIPRDAENISIKTGEGAVQALNEVVDNSSAEIISGITGNVVALSSGEGIFTRLFNLFRLTGRVIDENLSENIVETNETKIIDVVQISQDANETQVAVEYYTPAPLANETKTDNGKDVVVYSLEEFNYTNILAYTQLDNSISMDDKDKINLVWHASYGDALKYGYISVVENNSDVLVSNESSNESVVENLEVINNTDYLVENETISEEQNDSNVNNSDVVESVLNNSVSEVSEGVVSEENVSGGLLTGNVVVEIDELKNTDTHISMNNSSILPEFVNVSVGFEAYDLDGDNNIDYIEWNVPHLSAQSYSIVIDSSVFLTNVLLNGNYSHLSVNTSLTPYDGLKAYFGFDFNNGTRAADLSGNTNFGTYAGNAVIGTGLYGNALLLDGNADYVSTPLSLSSSGMSGSSFGNMTVSFWLKRGALGTTMAPFSYANGLAGSCGATNYNWVPWFSSANALSVRYYNNTQGCPLELGVATIADTTTWHHVVIAFNNTLMSSYVDGVSTANRSITNLNYNGSLFLYIGSYAQGNPTTLGFNGAIDEFMVFNSMLSGAQISAIYNNQSSRFVSSGNIVMKSQNLSAIYDKLNISFDDYQRNLNTNISTRIGSWDASLGYNNSDINGNNGLVSYWHFDGDYKDAMGLNNLTANNANMSVNNSGVFGNTSTFFGNSLGAYASWSSSLNITTNLSVSAWIKSNNYAQGNQVIVAKNKATNGDRSYIVYLAGNTLAVGQSSDGINTNTYTSGTNSVLTPAGQWMHVVVVFNGTNWLYYFNGNYYTITAGNTSGIWGSSTARTTIGAVEYRNDYWFNGSIDEVMIFNRTLNAADVQEIYNRGRAKWNYTAYQNLSDDNNLYYSQNYGGAVSAWIDGLTDYKGLNNGTLTGTGSYANWSSDTTKRNQTLQMNGTYGKYQQIPMSTSLNSSSVVSFSAWIKPTSNTLKPEVITATNAGAGSQGYFLGFTGNVLLVYIRNSTSNGWANSGTTGTSTASILNTWTHLVYIIDGVNNRTVAYRNGVLDLNSTLVGGWNQGGSNPLRIGGCWEGWDCTNSFAGAIDEVAVWNRSLTLAEVKNIYLSSKEAHSNNQFNISTNTTNILSELNLQSDSNLFYSPVVATTNSFFGNITAQDNIAPVLSILYPIVPLYVNYTANVPINFSVSDVDTNLTCWLTKDYGITNTTINCTNNASVNVSIGTNTVILYVNDSSGNLASARVTFLAGPTLPFGVNLLNNSYGTFSGISATSNYNAPAYSINNTVDNHLTVSNAYNTGWLSAVSTNVNVSINLTNSYDFDNIEVFDADWYTGGGHLSASPKDTNVWVSDDYSTWTRVANKTLFGSLPTNKGQYDYISFSKQNKKYIRLEFLNNWGDSNFIGTSEIRVFYNSSDLPNLTSSSITATNSASGYAATYLSDNLFATDDNDWRTNNGVTSANLTWNFSSIKRFNSLEFTGHSNANINYFPKDYTILVSSDGTNFNEIASGSFVGGLECYSERISFPEQRSQYLRLQIKNSYSTIIIGKEVRVYEQNDVVAPVISISYPANNSNFNYTTNIPLNFSVSDADTSLSCWWTNNSGASNNTIAGCNNTFINLSSGLTSLILYSNDSSGNLGNSTINLVADSISPAISFISPAQSGNQSQNYSYVNISSSDNAGDHFAVTNFDSSLFSWYRMDDLNSTGGVVDYLGRNNLTSFFSGASQTEVGKFGKAMSFNGALGGLQSSSINSSLYNTSAFSLCSWVYLKNNSANNTLFYWGHASVSPYTYFIFSADASNNLRFVFNNGSSKTISGVKLNNNSWFHVCLVLNSSSVVFYTNGSVGTTNAVTNLITTKNDVWDKTIIGSSVTNATLNGSMDEVIIFNRSLSASEISALYNASANKYYNNFTGLSSSVHNIVSYAVDLAGNVNSSSRTMNVDNIYPQVNLTYPLNTSYGLNISSLNYTASDSNLQSCWYSLDNGTTNTSVVCGSNLTGLTSSEGSNTWRVYVNDSAGNFNSSSVTFYKDSIAPALRIIFPTFEGAYNYHNQTLNYSVSDTNLQSCWKSLNGEANVTIPGCANTTVNYGGLGTIEGDNYLWLYANDSYGNLNATLVDFDINTISSSVVLMNPYDGVWLNNSLVNLSFKAIDNVSISNCSVYSNRTGVWALEVTNSTIANDTIYSNLINFNDGSYIWNVQCINSFNNIGWHADNHSFYVDASYPVWSNNKTSLNATTLAGSSVYFNITLNDLNAQNYVFSFYNTSVWENTTGSYINGQEISIIKTIDADVGDINWTWYFNDSAGNLNQTDVWNVNLLVDDNVAPSVVVISPLSMNYSNNNILFNVSAVDSSGVSSCLYSLGAGNLSLTNNGDYWSGNSSLIDGNYNVIFYCNDSHNNLNNSMQVNFGVDTIYPQLLIGKNASSVEFNQDSININWSASDNNLQSIVFNITYPNSSLLYSSTSSSGSLDLGSLNLTSIGVYTISLWANDSAGNANFSSTTFVVNDSLSPNVLIYSPLNNSNYSTTLINLNVSASDFSGISNYWYSLNSAANISFLPNISINAIEGQNSLVVYVNDSYGNTNTTSLFFNVDSISPALRIIFPTFEGAYNYHNQTLNYSVSDTNLQSCWKSLNGEANVTIPGCANTTVNYGGLGTIEGDNYLWLYANDSYGNLNATLVDFDINTVSSSVVLMNPHEGVWLNNSLVNLSFKAIDSVPINNCSIYSNRTGSWALEVTNSTIANDTIYSNLINFNDGSYIWNVQCINSFNNVGWHADNHSFYVDANAPQLNINKNASSVEFNLEAININWSVSDSNLQSIVFNVTYPDSSLLYSSTSSSGSIDLSSLNLTLLGNYTISLWANDTAGNANSSSGVFVVRDSLAPVFSPVPSNQVITYGDLFEYSTSAQDFGTGVASYSLNDSRFSINNSGYIVASNLSGGVYVLNESVSDIMGNVNSSVFSVVVNQANSSVKLYINNSENNVSIGQPASLLLNASLISGSGEVLLYQDGVLINSGLDVSNLSLFNLFKVYNITAIYSGNENYTSSSEELFVNLSDLEAPQIGLISPASSAALTNTLVSFVFNVSDLNEISNCTLNLDDENVASIVANRSINNIISLTVALGTHSWKVYCSDIANNTNVSRTRTFSVSSPAVVVGPSAGGGGGGGGGGAEMAPPVSKNLVVDTSEINVDFVKGSMRERVVVVRNLGDAEESVTVSQKGLDGLVSFSETSFVLQPGESKDVKITLIASEEEKIVSGKIIIGGKQILTSINTNSNPLLFDAGIVIPEANKKIETGSNLESQITLIPMAKDPRVDVTLNYAIKDFDGKVYLTESETILVEAQKTFAKEFYTKNLPVGNYVLSLELIYPNGVATSSSHFEVSSNKLNILSQLGYVGLISLIIVIVLLAYFMIRYKKRKSLVRIRGNK